MTNNELLDKILIMEAPESELWEAFTTVLRNFDWSYNFADDPDVWRRVAAEKLKLNECLRKMTLLDDNRASKLFFEVRTDE